MSAKLIEVRDFSISHLKRLERVVNRTDSVIVNIARINGYVTAMYLCFEHTDRFVRSGVNFLYPHGPSRSFSYPSRPDVLVISIHDILTIADPKTVTGRMYTLSSNETAAATLAASNH